MNLSTLVLFSAPLLAVQDDFAQELRQRLEQAFDLYRRGRYDEAFVQFEQAFVLDPSSDVVYALVRQVGEDMVAAMINSSDRRMQNAGRKILELARPGQVIRRDRGVIAQYVQDLRAPQAEVWQLAYWHLKNIGPYAMRDLVPLMGDETEDRQFRARVILLLSEIRFEGSLALIQALKSLKGLLRQNAALTLGHIRDERALPYLKRILENPNEDPALQRRAHEAMTRITRLDPSHWKTADEYFLRVAEKFYYAHPTAVFEWQPNDIVWSWDTNADRLVERDVPPFAFNEQVAEEYLYDLLEATPEHAGARGLLVCVQFAQILEARAALAAAQEGVRLGDVEAAVVQRVRTLLGNVERAAVVGSMVGEPYLYLALARSLEDGRSEVAVECCRALASMAREEDLPGVGAGGTRTSVFGTPLIQALTSDDKRVRYAAAATVARINPQSRKLGTELVIPNLVNALGEQGVRVCLVLHPARDERDWEAINRLRTTLLQTSAFPVTATNLVDGMVRARTFPVADVIFLEFGMAGTVYFEEETFTQGRVVEHVFTALSRDVRTRHIPVVIVCSSETELAEARQAYAGQAAGFITPAIQGPDVRALFEGLFAEADDAKNYADDLAAEAAEALAALDVPNTYFPYRTAVEALIADVLPQNRRPDKVRIPAIRALGRFGNVRALEPLAVVVADEANRPQIKAARLAAVEAIGAILAQNEVEVSIPVLDVLTHALVEGDLEIETATARTLSVAKLTPEQRRGLERLRRVQRPANP